MDNQLDRMLVSIGTEIDWPEPSTGFSQRVISRISTESDRRPLLRRVVPAFAMLAVLVAAIVTFSPATREAVADFLGIGGVRIEYTDRKSLPEPTTRPGDDLDLGQPVPLEEAQANVDFRVLVPTIHGAPDQVYLESIAPADMVSLVYTGRSVNTVEILITQFEGELMRQEDFLKKVISGGTEIERVDVNGSEGYWLSGEPHFFYYRSGGVVRDEMVRLVENVLLWVQNGVTLRIETAGSLDQALAIAESFR